MKKFLIICFLAIVNLNAQVPTPPPNFQAATAHTNISEFLQAKNLFENIDRVDADLDRSIQLLETYLQKNVNDSAAFSYLARVYTEKFITTGSTNTSLLEKAIEISTKSISIAPNLVEGYVTRSLAYCYKGDLKEAEVDLNKARTVNARFNRINEVTAEIELKKGNPDNYYKAYANAFSGTQDKFLKYKYGKIYGKLLNERGENFRAAMALDQVLGINPKDVEVILMLSEAYIRGQRLDDALELLKRVVPTLGGNVQAERELHTVALKKALFFMGIGELKAARLVCEDAIKLAKAPDCHYFLGATDLVEKNEKDADLKFEEGKQYDEIPKKLSSVKAIYLIKIGQQELAIPFFEQASKEETNNQVLIDLLNNFGEFYFNKKSDSKKSLELFEQASNLNSKNALTYYYIAHIKNIILGQHEESLPSYELANDLTKMTEYKKKISYEVAYAYYQLAEKKWNKLYIDRAIELYKKHIGFYPEDKAVAEELIKVQELEKELKSGLIGKIKKLFRDLNKKIFKE